MAASIAVEEEHATYSRSPHPHNGYYAGDFSQCPDGRPATRPAASRPAERSGLRSLPRS